MERRHARLEVGRALQKPRVDIEDVAWVGLSTRRPTQQQRELAIGAGVIGQVVVDDEHVAALGHKIFAHRGGGIGCGKFRPGGSSPLATTTTE